jgi:hypothetical protein
MNSTPRMAVLTVLVAGCATGYMASCSSHGTGVEGTTTTNAHMGQVAPGPGVQGDLTAILKPYVSRSDLETLLADINHWGSRQPGQQVRRAGIPVQAVVDRSLVIGFDNHASAAEKQDVRTTLVKSPYVLRVLEGGCDVNLNVCQTSGSPIL